MNGYKTVEELTADQFAELKDRLEYSLFLGEETYSECGLEEGADVTDAAVKKYYAGTAFTDDDFSCTAGSAENTAMVA